MTHEQPKNPLHGVTLKTILEDLVARRGWEELSGLVEIRCFYNEPTIKSSLKFLRKTDWARVKVERLYLQDAAYAEKRRKRNKRRAEMRAARTDQAGEE